MYSCNNHSGSQTPSLAHCQESVVSGIESEVMTGSHRSVRMLKVKRKCEKLNGALPQGFCCVQVNSVLSLFKLILC